MLWLTVRTSVGFDLTLTLESQVHTQRYGLRPYGVGLLVIGYDVPITYVAQGLPYVDQGSSV